LCNGNGDGSEEEEEEGGHATLAEDRWPDTVKKSEASLNEFSTS